jgi:Zn-dependent peptidase ImmA (M78 family)
MHAGVSTGDEETEAAANRYASALLMPRKACARDFRTVPFSWTHVFDLKDRWRVSAAAIVRRAYDLGLLSAVGYRRAFQYMSKMGWRTNGEPQEPVFQPPELLRAALDGLGRKVELTVRALCNELNFAQETLERVTGVPMPSPKANPVDVIAFPSAAQFS